MTMGKRAFCREIGYCQEKKREKKVGMYQKKMVIKK